MPVSIIFFRLCIYFRPSPDQRPHCFLTPSAKSVPSPLMTLNAKTRDFSNATVEKGPNKAGLLIAPTIEAGGNIPLKNTIIRIGAYYKAKLNCTPDGYNVYRHVGGLNFIGVKAGVIF